MTRQLLKNHWPLLVILAVAFILRIAVLNIQGEMFDEYPVAGVGKIYWGALKNFNFSNEIWYINYEHPPIAKLIYGFPATLQERMPFINKTFDIDFHPQKRYFLARFVSVLLGLLTIASVYFVCIKWFNSRIAIFASLFLALSPHLIAHNAIAGIETPQILVSIFVVYFYFKGLNLNNYKYVYISAFLFGIFFLTKFSALFYVFFYISAAIAMYYKGKVKVDKRFIKTLIISALISCITIYLIWPWLWPNPLNLIKSITYFDNKSQGEFFMGSTGQPPIYYYLVYFAVTTPPAFLVFAALAIAKVRKNFMVLIVCLWLLTPFTISILGLKKDGIRYVITFLPPLSILAAVGFNQVLNDIKNEKLKYLIVMVTFFSLIWSLIKFFPYYLDYYNIFIGGTETVYNRRLLDYAWWGEGIKESVLYVNKNYHNTTVYPILNPGHVAPLFRENITVLDNKEVLQLHHLPQLILIGENYFYYSKEPEILTKYKLVKTFNVNEIPLVRLYEQKP